MSEHMFFPTRRPLTKATARKLQRIAERHGADFVGPVKLPGNTTTGWFSGPNRGLPFDREMERAVAADLTAAGIEL